MTSNGAGHLSRTTGQAEKSLFICNIVRRLSTEGFHRLYQDLIFKGGQQQNCVAKEYSLVFGYQDRDQLDFSLRKHGDGGLGVLLLVVMTVLYLRRDWKSRTFTCRIPGVVDSFIHSLCRTVPVSPP